MGLNREDILDRTHYGLKIYAHVLRQYYPGTVLSLRGRDCAPAQNPFNEDKSTLMINIHDECATHMDKEDAIPVGDALDFAGMHYEMKGQALYQKLNEGLNLGLDEPSRRQYLIKEKPSIIPVKKKVRLPRFSYFQKPVSNTIPECEATLVQVYKLIKGDSYKKATGQLRQITDAKKARKYKAYNFDYVTFSGIFSKRNDNNLQCHSGLITVDFDHLKDVGTLREALLNDGYFDTELLFISPSGDGLKWVIPIDLKKAKHQDYFKAIANYVKQTYHLEIDQSGKDISRACFLPHDPNVYINPKYL